MSGSADGVRPEAGRAFFAFELSPELLARTEAIIDKLRSAEDRRARLQELIAVVLELTETGLDAYYLKPLELAEVGFASRSAAKVGVAAAGKGIPVIVRKVLGKMSDEQLLTVADFMDGILIREGTKSAMT